MESTARGRSSAWHRICKASERGILAWDFVFMEWFREPGYSIAVPENYEKTQEEEAITRKCEEQLKFKLSDNQLAWRRAKMAEFDAVDGSPEKFYQEFPFTPTEAFLTAGRCAFSKKRLNEMLVNFCRPPKWTGSIRLDPNNVSFKLTKQENGNLRIWEMPITNQKLKTIYYIAADPSMGLTNGDPCCAQVLAVPEDIRQPLRQVARWHGWAPPTQFARILAALGYMYGTAEIAPECNIITTVASDLVKVLNYPKWYRWMREDKAKNAYSNWIGWVTNFRNKNELIARFREALDEWTVVIRCEEDIDEMMGFIEEEEGSGRYSGKEHDDAIMSLMIGYYISTQLRPREGGEVEKPVPEGIDYQNTDWSIFHDNTQAIDGDWPDYNML
jgi:hypothetical protein